MSIHNRVTALKLLYRDGKLSIQELAKKMDLSVAAGSKILKSLREGCFITQSKDYIPSHGKHQGFWQINKSRRLFLCINITPNGLRSLVVDSLGEPLMPLKEENHDFNSSSELLQALLAVCSHWLAFFPNLGHVGISVMGLVDIHSGISTFRALMGHQTEVDIISYLEEHTSLRVKIENDCNVFVLAEKWLGRHSGSFVFLFASQGIGCSFVQEGKLFLGSHTTALQGGHINLSGKNDLCPCGGKGCVELYSNSAYLLKMSGCESLKLFFEEYLGGNPNIQKIYHEAIRYLAQIGGMLITMLNPDKIIFSGSVFIPEIIPLWKKNIGEYSIPVMLRQCDIVPSGLSQEQLIAGAAFLWIEEDLFL